MKPMFMLCWHYCVPFMSLLYYAIGPVLVMFAAYTVRRGIYRRRPNLRKAGFCLMIISFAKIFIDLTDIMMNIWHFTLAVSYLAGIGGGILTGYILRKFCRKYHVIWEKGVKLRSHDKEARAWASASMIGSLLLFLWLMLSWGAGLMTGDLPTILVHVPWKLLAVTTAGILMVGFWEVEACHFHFDARKGKPMGTTKNWMPRDTLWTAFFLYIIIVVLLIVSDDIMTAGGQ